MKGPLALISWGALRPIEFHRGNRGWIEMLTTTNEPGQEFSGGIRFIMMDSDARVTCWVSGEALDGAEGGNASQHERAMRFERHRDKIEKLADRKYGTGDSSPIVMTFDLGSCNS
jgi:hypothetical protein